MTQPELVFALVCPLGTDYGNIVRALQAHLALFQYDTHIVRLSDFIPRGTVAERIAAGNLMCETAQDQAAFARLAAREIAANHRPGRAHIVVTLKRPAEAALLREIYGSGFFLLSISSVKEDREAYFRSKGLSDVEIEHLIEIDTYEAHEYGQKTRETFHLADCFVSDHTHQELIPRFVDLLFGSPLLTPSLEEHAMFMAYSASLRSGDLSRQVGSAIVDEYDDLLAIGYNDAPSGRRDLELGVDSNELEKREMARRIFAAMGQGDADDETIRRTLKPTGLYDITEFGRAVHAEMHALLACARTGRSPRGATLYTTTFPCHNCCRHILSAGIRRVYYIEPYAKSKAPMLHGEEISIDRIVAGRVPFLPFLGVGPRRYFDLFSLTLSSGYAIQRKRDGYRIEWDRAAARLRLHLRADSYLEREQAAIRTPFMKNCTLETP